MRRTIRLHTLAAALLAIAIPTTAGAQTAEQAAASQMLYNVKGGQSVAVAETSELGARQEAIRLTDLNQRMIKLSTETWGIQPLVGPQGLTRMAQGPLTDRNIRSSSGTSLANVDSLLVDPATGLVHYLVGTGAAVGAGNYVLVPISAIDLGNMQTPMNPRDMGMQLKPYSGSKLDSMYPAQQVTVPVQAVAIALLPKEVAVGLAKPKSAAADAATEMLTDQGMLVGQDVSAKGGAAVGKVVYLVVDRQSNDVKQLVVAVPFFGENQHVIVPMSEVKFDAAGNVEVARSADELGTLDRHTDAEVKAMYGG